MGAEALTGVEEQAGSIGGLCDVCQVIHSRQHAVFDRTGMERTVQVLLQLDGIVVVAVLLKRARETDPYQAASVPVNWNWLRAFTPPVENTVEVFQLLLIL